MPCNCDHMKASTFERDLSRVACLLGELEGRKWTKGEWDGYHADTYNKATRELGDELVSKLCTAMKGRDVSKLSLEMQMWWRDHQKADRERETRESRK